MLWPYPTELKRTRIFKHVKSIMNMPFLLFIYIFIIFLTFANLREIIFVFPDLTKTFMLAFSWTPFKEDLLNRAQL